MEIGGRRAGSEKREQQLGQGEEGQRSDGQGRRRRFPAGGAAVKQESPLVDNRVVACAAPNWRRLLVHPRRFLAAEQKNKHQEMNREEQSVVIKCPHL